jgi:hypothetical protein
MSSKNHAIIRIIANFFQHAIGPVSKPVIRELIVQKGENVEPLPKTEVLGKLLFTLFIISSRIPGGIGIIGY